MERRGEGRERGEARGGAGFGAARRAPDALALPDEKEVVAVVAFEYAIRSWYASAAAAPIRASTAPVRRVCCEAGRRGGVGRAGRGYGGAARASLPPPSAVTSGDWWLRASALPDLAA